MDQLNPQELIRSYCHVIAQSDSQGELDSVSGMLDDVFFYNTPDHSIRECNAYYVKCALQEYQSLSSPERKKDLADCRLAALSSVLRAAVQGGKLPTSDFWETIETIRSAMGDVMLKNRDIYDGHNADDLLRREICKTYYYKMDKVAEDRSNYAMSLLQKPRTGLIAHMFTRGK